MKSFTEFFSQVSEKASAFSIRVLQRTRQRRPAVGLVRAGRLWSLILSTAGLCAALMLGSGAQADQEKTRAEWPSAGQNLDNTRVNAAEHTISPANASRLAVKWVFQTAGDVSATPAVELPQYDAIIFGTPTRFGNMAGQMRNFLDQTGSLWLKGAFVGKVGSVFTSTGTGGGNESTILTFIPTLLHHGMIYVGLLYAIPEMMDIRNRTNSLHDYREKQRSPCQEFNRL